MDVAHTLLFNTTVPKHFSGDVLTACQLINHMPSAVLNHRSSFSLLYPDCAPFPLTRLVVLPLFKSLILTKISYPPRAYKCALLGYSHAQKSYRCYSPESSRYFGDVKFFESTSSYS